jgi:hypothetical protein
MVYAMPMRYSVLLPFWLFQCFCRSQCCPRKSNARTILLKGTWKNTLGDSVAEEASGPGGHTIGTIVLRSRVMLGPCSNT